MMANTNKIEVKLKIDDMRDHRPNYCFKYLKSGEQATIQINKANKTSDQ